MCLWRRQMVLSMAVGLVSAFVLSVLTIAPAEASPGLTRPGPTTSDCGGVLPSKADGSRWVCSFSDDFSGSTLNSSKWMIATTAGTGFATQDTCYVNNSNNVAVRQGTLNITAITGSKTFLCERG